MSSLGDEPGMAAGWPEFGIDALMISCVVLICFFLLLVSVSSPESKFAHSSLFLEHFRFSPAPALQHLIDPIRSDPAALRWTGGDCACSWIVTFPDIASEYQFWFFADTTLGVVNSEGKRSGDFQMIHSSVGVYSEGWSHLDFTWRVGSSGLAASFFTPINESVYYWPTQVVGFRSLEKLDEYELFVVLTRQLINGTFLEGDGEAIAHIRLSKENILRPREWNVTITRIPFDFARENGFEWGSAALTVVGDFVHLLGARSGVTRDVYLGRMRVVEFRSLEWLKLQFWCVGEKWEFGYPAALNLLPIQGLTPSTEVNLFWSDIVNSFLMIKIPDFMGMDMHVYTAKNVTGPFVDLGTKYSIPKPWSSTPNIVVYAFKMHPYLAGSKNELVLTYNVNCFGCPWDMLVEYYVKFDEFYVPQILRIEFVSDGKVLA